jgi:hypothetical protein
MQCEDVEVGRASTFTPSRLIVTSEDDSDRARYYSSDDTSDYDRDGDSDDMPHDGDTFVTTRDSSQHKDQPVQCGYNKQKEVQVPLTPAQTKNDEPATDDNDDLKMSGFSPPMDKDSPS